MFSYEDYFDDQLNTVPYGTRDEQLLEVFNFLDLILESYLERKGLSTDEKLFSRGLVITESEVRNYYQEPPILRDVDDFDPFLSESYQKAMEHIHARAKVTKKVKLPLSEVEKLFSLTNYELLAVILALAVRIDRKYERIFGFLQDDVAENRPTAGLLEALYNRCMESDLSRSEELLDPEGKMVTYFFKLPGGKTRERRDGLSTPLILNRTMVEFLIGLEKTKDHASLFREIIEKEKIPVFFDEEFEQIRHIEKSGAEKVPFHYIESSDPGAVTHLLYKVITPKKLLYVFDADNLRDYTQEEQNQAENDLLLITRLRKARIAVRVTKPEAVDSRSFHFLFDKLKKKATDATVYIFGMEKIPETITREAVPVMKLEDPDVRQRTGMFSFFLKNRKLEKELVLEDVADCYDITYSTIKTASEHAISTTDARREEVLSRERLLDSLLQLNSVRFDGLATLVRAVYRWEDITMAESQRRVLKVACDRYRLRNRIGDNWGLKKKNAYGNGVSILVYGPPGTGKTMAAQVIANELGLPLYRIDLSQIFSKYIGETEKNLSAIFTEASKANVILFFDEADALFSKRTDIVNSNDKFANSETAYLLQKIEEYRGISILATNFFNNFDTAFVRRITYAAHLESPNEEERYQLWTKTLPKDVPMEKNIDFRFLAEKFELSGSNIKAILYSASYMAGAEGTELGPKHIVKAMKFEFDKLGKMIDTADFGVYAGHVFR